MTIAPGKPAPGKPIYERPQPKPMHATARPAPPKVELDCESRVLTIWRNARTEVVLELLNGRELRGRIAGFAKFSIDLETDGETVVVLKHSISLIRAVRAETKVA